MTPPSENRAAAERTYAVSGMTCGHCAASVREEVGELADVEVVDVDHASGRLVVSGPAAADEAAIAGAVEAAGYAIATR